jgi:hypothetical protein
MKKTYLGAREVSRALPSPAVPVFRLVPSSCGPLVAWSPRRVVACWSLRLLASSPRRLVVSSLLPSGIPRCPVVFVVGGVVAVARRRVVVLRSGPWAFFVLFRVPVSFEFPGWLLNDVKEALVK